jgi:hypothetical protein
MDRREKGTYDGIEGRMVMDSMRSVGGERGRIPISGCLTWARSKYNGSSIVTAHLTPTSKINRTYENIYDIVGRVGTLLTCDYFADMRKCLICDLGGFNGINLSCFDLKYALLHCLVHCQSPHCSLTN